MQYRNACKYKDDRGLTLVELAVVMIIIGVLIGGILIGARMIHNAGLSSTYAKTQILGRALNEFVGQYDVLPGDMEDATTRLGACTGGACVNGNGDGVIGDPSQQIFFNAAAGDETELAWRHLQAADLITEINPGAPAGSGWSESFPAAESGGGYILRAMGGQQAGLSGVPVMGIFVRWQGAPGVAANTPGGFVVSPHDAWWIDNKYDDGAPLAGRIRTRGTGAGFGGDGCSDAAGNDYTANINAVNCYMYFRIRESVGQ